MNIISNAIEAIKDKGEIIISTDFNETDINISIKDNGIGMDEEIKSKIFDPFFTTKDVGKGVGLGLYITYGIIKEHKGSLKLNSKVNQNIVNKS